MEAADPRLRATTSKQLAPETTEKQILPGNDSNAAPARVLFVNRSYWPDMEATGQLLTELCQSIARTPGYEVSVLCGQPNFNDGNVDFQKHGTQLRKNVCIRRTSHTMFDKSNFIGRAVNFLSFCACAFFSLLFGKRPDVIVCQTDPPFAPIAACLVAFVRRTKFVCYLQDIYPDIAVQCGKINEGFAVKVLRKFLVWCYCRADRIVVVSNDMRDWLRDHGVSESKVTVIHNWVDTTAVHPVKSDNPFRQSQLLDGKFVVMYSGNVGQTQRFEMVLDAAERLQRDESIVFLIVGGGAKLASVMADAERRKLSNVRFLPYQPKSELAISLSAADVQLVLLDQTMTQLMMPSKLYSALASGTPILGIGDRWSHLASIVLENECGWFFDESQLDDLVDTLRQAAAAPAMITRMGEAARRSAVTDYSRGRSVAEFSHLLDQITAREKSMMPDAPLGSPQEVVGKAAQVKAPNFESHSLANEQLASAVSPEQLDDCRKHRV
jgi:glycosyltransferase involved in cell wall biosynthesis